MATPSRRILIDHARLVTVAGGDGPLAGPRQGRVGLVVDGALAVEAGLILAAGPREDVLRQVASAWGAAAEREQIDADGRVVMPGLVDAHSHPVWAGSRVAELELRIRGAGYVEIMEAGGGIASTVRATRDATDEALLADLLTRLDQLMDHGVTTLEAKSGYGLSTAEELRHLRVLAQAAARHPMRIVPTFLGAHAVPDEFRGRDEAYVDLVVEEMLPAVAAAFPGAFCDAFCDLGAFSLAQTERVLNAARALGLPLKVHADEFGHLGCAELAARLGAVSADHCIVTSPADMDAMARSGTVAVLLPGTTLGLGSLHFAPARELLLHGVPLALGTDLNPGSCPCPDLPLIMAMAARYLKLTPDEVLVAATRNAAYASGRGAVAGRLEAGFAADLLLLEAQDHRELCYAFGQTPRMQVMVGGIWTRQTRALAIEGAR